MLVERLSSRPLGCLWFRGKDQVEMRGDPPFRAIFRPLVRGVDQAMDVGEDEVPPTRGVAHPNPIVKRRDQSEWGARRSLARRK